ncbi:MAG: group III truncated hemoglobin [Crocinitomicaceae bacterium]
MNKELNTRADIVLLVNSFYDKVKQDAQINPFFEEVANVNWNQHLTIMYDFWENVLLHTGKYDGNPMVKHQNIHHKKPLSKEDFMQWQKLFNATIDENFSGKNADLAKLRAKNIATVMQAKILP